MYSSHPSDFPAQPLPVMIDPILLILALLLVGLVVGAAAYFAGRRDGRRTAVDHDGKHREAIYKAIAKAAEAAMKASRHEVMAKGEALHAEIRRQLGDVLAVAAAVGAVEGLRRALDGQPHGDGGGHDDHGGADGHGGHGAGAPPCGPVIFNSGKLVMGKLDEAAAPTHAEGGHAESHSVLSHEETVAAVRRAVERVSDHWADKTARLDDLRRAQIQLSPRR